MDGCSRVAGTGRCSWADRTNRVRWRWWWIDRTNWKHGIDRCGRLSRFWWRYRAFGTYWRGRQRGFPRFPRTYGFNRCWRKCRRNWPHWLDRRYRGGVHNHRTNRSHRHPRLGVHSHRSDRLYRSLSYGRDRSGFDNHGAYRSHRHRRCSLHSNRADRMDRSTDHRADRRCLHSDGSYGSHGSAGCCVHSDGSYGSDGAAGCCLHSDGTNWSDGCDRSSK